MISKIIRYNKVKLNIGCGNDIKEGYINLDLFKRPGVDVEHDFNKRLPFQDNSFDEIYCNNVLEHTLYLPKVLKELHRITRNKGLIIIKSPYFTSSSAYMNPEHKSFFTYSTFKYLQKYWGDFKVIKRRLIYSQYFPLSLLNPFFNILPKVYERFFANIIPCSEIDFILEVKK